MLVSASSAVECGLQLHHGSVITVERVHGPPSSGVGWTESTAADGIDGSAQRVRVRVRVRGVGIIRDHGGTGANASPTNGAVGGIYGRRGIVGGQRRRGVRGRRLVVCK